MKINIIHNPLVLSYCAGFLSAIILMEVLK
jgi:hypothetical protein